jgi:hypothetical protein
MSSQQQTFSLSSFYQLLNKLNQNVEPNNNIKLKKFQNITFLFYIIYLFEITENKIHWGDQFIRRACRCNDDEEQKWINAFYDKLIQFEYKSRETNSSLFSLETIDDYQTTVFKHVLIGKDNLFQSFFTRFELKELMLGIQPHNLMASACYALEKQTKKFDCDIYTGMNLKSFFKIYKDGYKSDEKIICDSPFLSNLNILELNDIVALISFEQNLFHVVTIPLYQEGDSPADVSEEKEECTYYRNLNMGSILAEIDQKYNHAFLSPNSLCLDLYSVSIPCSSLLSQEETI